MIRRLALAAVCLSILACGKDSPVAPSPPPLANVSGTWSGTWQATQVSGGGYIIAYVMSLNQSGANVTGTWSTAQGNGTVTGTTTTSSFSGTLTWNATTTIGTACTGTFAVAGSAGANTVAWTSPAVTGNCSNLPTAIVIAAQLR